jgi:tagaturonate reductase
LDVRDRGEVVAADGVVPHPARAASVSAVQRPSERILQFGTGRFVRGFVDAFVDEETRGSATTGLGTPRRVTVVETSGSGAAGRLRAQACRYRLLTRGLDDGLVVDEDRVIEVIDRTIDASERSDALVAAAVDPEITMVVSNAAGGGYRSGRLPALLSQVLEARGQAGLPGMTILPCELIESNGTRLRELVVADARGRDVSPLVVDHVADSNVWTVTLVDRIATAPVEGDRATQGDPFAVVVEPYASWVVEGARGAPLPDHPAIERTEDVLPFAVRKIRILNGAHTALVSRTRGRSIALVREAMDDPEIAAWLEELLLGEVVPALGDRIVDGAGFVRSVLERFRNPFQDHRLADIAAGHAEKLAVRMLPTYHDHLARFGRPPRLLGALLASEGLVP